MKSKFCLLIILIFITGCGGLSYKIELPNNYELYSKSSHDAKIFRSDGMFLDEKSLIPPKVVELNWNDKFIVAKQYGLKNLYSNYEENSYQVPDETKIFYWIIDTEEQITYGPYTSLNEYKQKLKEFNIQNLKLKKITEYENLKKFN